MRLYRGGPAKLAAPEPTFSSELMRFVADRYGLSAGKPRDLGGSFDLNVLVDGKVIRVYGPWVTGERLKKLQRIRRTLGDLKQIVSRSLTPDDRGNPRHFAFPGRPSLTPSLARKRERGLPLRKYEAEMGA